MAGYDDTKKKIINTLLGRPSEEEIQPDKHQGFALNLLEYIRGVEITANGPLVGVAYENTVPIQPDSSRAAYIAGVAQEKTAVFENFIQEDGRPVTIKTGEMEGNLVILIWNTRYWSYESIPTNIISQSNQANFYYNLSVRKTYASVADMNADSVNPIGTDGRLIKIGELVTVVNSASPAANGYYSYEGSENGWLLQSGFSFEVVQTTGTDVNKVMSQKAVSKEFASVQDELSDITDILDFDYSEIYSLSPNNVYQGGILSITGKFTIKEDILVEKPLGLCRTSYIPLLGASVLRFKTEVARMARPHFYDKNKKWLGQSEFNSDSSVNVIDGADYMAMIINIPEDNIFIYPDHPLAVFNADSKRLNKIENDIKELNLNKRPLRHVVLNRPLYISPLPDSVCSASTTINDVYTRYDQLIQAYPNFVSKVLLGKSLEGLPIYEYTFCVKKPYYAVSTGAGLIDKKWDKDYKPVVLVNSGTHGDEKGSVWGLLLFLEQLCYSDDLAVLKNNLAIKVIPILNPEGFRDNTRLTPTGVNINRDFIAFTRPESQLVAQWCANNKEEAIALLDFHNTSKKTSIWSTDYNYLMKNISTNISHELENDWIQFDPSLADYSPLCGYVNFIPNGTMDNFAESLGLISATIESARHSDGLKAISVLTFNKLGIKSGIDLLSNVLFAILNLI